VGEKGISEWFGWEGMMSCEGFERFPSFVSLRSDKGFVESCLKSGELLRCEG